jgi:hydroxymethylpyrimidine pyrophosphatase-like HAD family hydrolase
MEPYLDAFAHQARYRPVATLLGGRSPLRLVSFAPLERLRPLAEAMSDLDAGWQILETGSYGQAELTLFAMGVSKGAALARLATDLGVPLAETLAIGDGSNDISMLRAAGLGVAMGHAAPSVRLAADVVTASNTDDGAAQAIERYILSEPGEPDDVGELAEEPA